jgi:hypothetical protein
MDQWFCHNGNDFMAKFSSADRPPITPSSLGLTPRFNLTPSANVLSQILPAAGKPPLAPSVQNLMDMAGSSGIFQNGRKTSAEKPVQKNQTNDSSLRNLLNGKENRNSGSQNTLTRKSRNKNKKQSRKSQGMPSYLGFPKVDALDTPTNSRPTTGIDTLDSSVEKPKELCCQWSLDRNAENTVIDLIVESPENPLKDNDNIDENLNTTEKITGLEIDASNSADLQFEPKKYHRCHWQDCKRK